MKKPATAAPMVARVYLRVSTDAQDLERQEAITTAAKAAGYESNPLTGTVMSLLRRLRAGQGPPP